MVTHGSLRNMGGLLKYQARITIMQFTVVRIAQINYVTGLHLAAGEILHPPCRYRTLTLTPTFPDISISI